MLMGLRGLILGEGDYNDKPNGRNPDTTQVKDSRSCCLSNVPGAMHQLCKSFKPGWVSKNPLSLQLSFHLPFSTPFPGQCISRWIPNNEASTWICATRRRRKGDECLSQPRLADRQLRSASRSMAREPFRTR